MGTFGIGGELFTYCQKTNYLLTIREPNLISRLSKLSLPVWGKTKIMWSRFGIYSKKRSYTLGFDSHSRKGYWYSW